MSSAAFIYGICKGMTPEDTLRIAAGTGAIYNRIYTFAGIATDKYTKKIRYKTAGRNKIFIHK